MRLPASLMLAGLAVLVAGNARADIVIKVDKSAQRMTVIRNGEVLRTWPVSTGRTGYATPSGTFTAFRMEADHYSKEWDDAPMPHSIFFTQNGMAVHGSFETKNLGRPVSHGCVRISPAHAAELFEMVEEEGLPHTKVVLTGSEQVALARLNASPTRAADRSLDVQQPPRLAAQQDAYAAQPLNIDSYGQYRPSREYQSYPAPRRVYRLSADPRVQYEQTFPRYQSNDEEDDDE